MFYYFDLSKAECWGLVTLNTENLRPVSLLSHISKAFERLLYEEIKAFLSNKLSVKISGFRKNHNTQCCLTCMLEKWSNALEKSKHVGAVLMDLSKAFETINYDSLTAKLEAYGFSNNAWLFILSYFKKCQMPWKKCASDFENILNNLLRFCGDDVKSSELETLLEI